MRVLLIFGLILLVSSMCLSCDQSPRIVRPPSDPLPPTIEHWNYKIETPSRTYYVKAYKKIGEDIIVDGYYDLSDGKWVWCDQRLVLNERTYGYVSITRRPDIQIK